MTEQGSRKERIIVGPSLLSWNQSDFVYHPEFDLGIGEGWLPKHPVARVSGSIDVLNQDDSSIFVPHTPLNFCQNPITTKLSCKQKHIGIYRHESFMP